MFLVFACLSLIAVLSALKLYTRYKENQLKAIAGKTSIQGTAAQSLSSEKMRIRKSAREKGIIGELGVAARLEELAVKYGLTVLHDLSIPGSKANIDHVVIASKAVFVIDAKNYAGKVNIKKDPQGVKQLYVGKYKHTNLAIKLKSYADAIKSHLSNQGIEIKVIPLLAFYNAEFGDNSDFHIDGVAVNVAGVEIELLKYATGKGREFDIEEVARSIKEAFPFKG